MYNNASQFDGNAAFSGGGFMPSQATQSADTSSAPAKSRDAQALVPVTVKQISEALLASSDNSSFVVDGVDVNNVTLVGLVSNKVERVTDVGFDLHDGTGAVEVTRWANEASDFKETENMRDGMYIRIHANLRGFQGKKKLVAFATRPITDFNEITFHFMECIYVHLYNSKLRAAPTVSADAQAISSVNGGPYRGYQGTQQNQFAGQVANYKGVDQLLAYLQLPANMAKERGVHISELERQLGAPMDKIMASIKALEDEGLVYSTIDDEHYKSTGNG